MTDSCLKLNAFFISGSWSELWLRIWTKLSCSESSWHLDARSSLPYYYLSKFHSSSNALRSSYSFFVASYKGSVYAFFACRRSEYKIFVLIWFTKSIKLGLTKHRDCILNCSVWVCQNYFGSRLISTSIYWWTSWNKC
jgi:hypothetical protein